MKYGVKVAIVPFDKYQRLNNSQNNSMSNHMNSEYNIGQINRETTRKEQDNTSKSKELQQNIDSSNTVETNQNISSNDSDKIETNEIETENLDSILKYLPRIYEKSAKLLLQYLTNKTNIRWNEDGEIIINGETIVGSHIAELVKDAITNRNNKNNVPIGINVFYENVGNIPDSLLRNDARRILLAEGTQFHNKIEPNIDHNPIIKAPPPGLPDTIKSKSLDTYFKSIKWKNLWKKVD